MVQWKNVRRAGEVLRPYMQNRLRVQNPHLTAEIRYVYFDLFCFLPEAILMQHLQTALVKGTHKGGTGRWKS